MDDRELTQILVEIGRDRFRPPDELVRRTKQCIHGSRVIPVMVFLSLGLHLLTAAGVGLMLLGSEATWARSLIALAVLSLLSGTSLLLVIAVREPLAAICIQLDRVVGT